MRARPFVVVPFVVLALAVVTLVACDGGDSGNLPNPTSAGAQLFTANCATCHGADAGGLSGPSLRGGIPAAKVEKRIRDGVPNKMPKFEKRLSEADIATLTEYVSTLPAKGDSGG